MELWLPKKLTGCVKNNIIFHIKASCQASATTIAIATAIVIVIAIAIASAIATGIASVIDIASVIATAIAIASAITSVIAIRVSKHTHLVNMNINNELVSITALWLIVSSKHQYSINSISVCNISCADGGFTLVGWLAAVVGYSSCSGDRIW